MKRFLTYENFASRIMTPGMHLVMHDGDLERRYKKFGVSDPMVRDIVMYMKDENVLSTKREIQKKWNHVKTVNDTKFPIFRGFSLKPGDSKYKFWEEKVNSEKSSPVIYSQDTVEFSDSQFTSWTKEPWTAASYAEGREGDLKVVLYIKDVSQVKVFANLYEIGDESEELIVYPINNTKATYIAWKVK